MLLLSSKLNERSRTAISLSETFVAASTMSPALFTSRTLAVTVLSTSYPSTWFPQPLTFGEMDRFEVWTSLSATPAFLLRDRQRQRVLHDQTGRMRPVPLAPLAVHTRTLRPGKRVQWLEASLVVDDQEVARAGEQLVTDFGSTGAR